MSTTTHTMRCTASEAEESRLRELMAKAPPSVGRLFLDRVERTPHREAFRRPDGLGGWESFTWAQTRVAVTELAAGLIALGIAPQDRVAISSGTRLDWIHADLAVMCAGAATTTIYPTSTPDDVRHILADSGSRLVFVEDTEQLAKIRDDLGSLPQIGHVVLFDSEEIFPGDTSAAAQVMSLADLRERGRAWLAEHPDAVTDRVADVQPEHLATLIYTSGTTGRPKGVRLPHRCWVYEGLAVQALGEALRPDDVAYLWLPLSHSFGKVLLAAQVAIGHTAAVDGAVDKIVTNLPAVRPTGMAGAPRIFEKVYARVVGTVEAEGGAKAKIFAWAFDVGRQVSRLRQQGHKPAGALAVKNVLADRLVFSKIRDRFGGRIRNFISGSAALSGDIAEWFDAAGLTILEGYGLTETSAAATVNRPNRYRTGTVGVPLPGTEVRLDTDGEILLKGPGIMDGYHNLPEATAEVLVELDGDGGWFRTGDIGEITPDGFLRITDRKKDLIKTSGGKYVAPQSIETRFKALCPLVSQIVVHGEGRKFVSALITLDPDAVLTWAAAHGMTGLSYAEVVTSAPMTTAVTGYVSQLNANLGKWETIKRFEVLDHDLTIESGHLTPSLKLRRRAVEAAYADHLNRFYTD